MARVQRKRKAVKGTVRQAVLGMHGRCCAKCASTKDIHIHHLVAVMDGGSNDADNLIPLCAKCHKEWHYVESLMVKLPFDKWLSLPPYYVMLAALESWPDFPDIQAAWTTTTNLRKSIAEMAQERPQE